mmetsp:Transcript_5712/g.6261  ORF Transcript_5712/g.6261 Transcript_5712/m.6261 type:complete len:424 (-) Transcript_5712:33-1304(-)
MLLQRGQSLLMSSSRRAVMMGKKNIFRTTRSFASGDLVKTALYDFHKELGGDMVPFAGYELPVLYKGDNGGVMKEHLWCRSKASLFDVSHMGQILWHGKDRIKFLEKVVVGDIAGLKPGQSCLSLITNEKGGIIDDTVITNAGDYIYMVVNGACKHGDMKHFKEQLELCRDENLNITMDYLEESMSLLALQGPEAAAVLSKLIPSDIKLESMGFMEKNILTSIDGIYNCRITRCGYTGEDGFELSIPSVYAESIASKLLEDDRVLQTGLGARDSLRLEAGLCLYGNDLDETTTPVEGVLAWTFGKGGPKARRRNEKGFVGHEHILAEDSSKLQKVNRKRVGIMGMKAPARQNVEIFSEDEKPIGIITSGTFSPTLKKPIAMGYVETASAKAGTDVLLKIRNKFQKATITKMPFVPNNYYRVEN